MTFILTDSYNWYNQQGHLRMSWGLHPRLYDQYYMHLVILVVMIDRYRLSCRLSILQIQITRLSCQQRYHRISWYLHWRIYNWYYMPWLAMVNQTTISFRSWSYRIRPSIDDQHKMERICLRLECLQLRWWRSDLACSLHSSDLPQAATSRKTCW